MPKTGTTNTIPLVNSAGGRELLSTALNAAESLRTLIIPINGDWEGIRLTVDHANAAATNVSAAVFYRLRRDGPLAARQVGSETSGDIALSDMSTTKTLSSDDVFGIELDCAGIHEYVLVFSGAGAGGSDTISVEGVAYAR